MSCSYWPICSFFEVRPSTFARIMARSSAPRLYESGWGESGVKTLYIQPGSPWENGYNESFNGKLRDELLDREIFYTLQEAKVLIEQWRRHYNRVRPHSALGYRPPAPEAMEIPPLLGRQQPTDLGTALPLN